MFDSPLDVFFRNARRRRLEEDSIRYLAELSRASPWDNLFCVKGSKIGETWDKDCREC